MVNQIGQFVSVPSFFFLPYISQVERQMEELGNYNVIVSSTMPANLVLVGKCTGCLSACSKKPTCFAGMQIKASLLLFFF